MTWLAWRQARAQALVAIAATAIVAVVLVATRNHIASTPEEDLSTVYSSLQLLGTVLIGVPAAIGAFWGAPLLARELELGTHRLAWTQGVTRGRWLASKLVVLAAATIVVTTVFAALFTWWSLPLDAHGNRIGTANFGQRGIVPIAYALFALALGALVGAIIRRTLPAMAATLVGFVIARFTFQWVVRPRLVDTVTLTRPLTMFGPPDDQAATAGAWVMSSSTVDNAGHVLPTGAADQLLAQACNLTRTTSEASYTR
jgi:ABC-type transport system involved in multi-copper enzyme maturation permease subunit